MKSTNAKLKSLALLCLISLVAASCGEDPVVTPPPTVVKEWSIPLSTKNENPGLATRNETGTATLQLLSDNSLKYTINVTGLASGDALVAAHIHTGDVITNGGIIQNLNPTFAGGTSSGTIASLRTSLVDSLKNDANELYFNVHSTQVGSGLVRGQLNTKLEMVANVLLNGANEVPAITTTATGVALLRLTSNKKLYSRVTVSGLETGDVLNAAHIHTGAAGAIGPIYIGLYASSAEFGTAKILTVTDAQIAVLKTDALYVNVHSTAKPGGIVRGQVR